MAFRRDNSDVRSVMHRAGSFSQPASAIVLRAGLALLASTLGAVGVCAAASRAVQSCSHAFVTNAGSDTVSVIDVGTNEVVTTVRLSADENVCRGDTVPNVLGLTDIVVAPNGAFAYVSSKGCAVFVLLIGTNDIVGKIVLAKEPVGPVTFGPDSAIAYIGGSGAVTSIDTATNAIVDQIAIGKNPIALALSVRAAALYVLTDEGVSVVDTRTKSVTSSVALPGSPNAMALAPNGRSIYVASLPKSVSVIDAATGVVTATILVGQSPSSLAVTPDGGHVYVTGDPLSVIDTRTNIVAATIDLPNSRGIAMRSDGSAAYVTNGVDSVSVVSTSSNSVTTTIAVPDCGLNADPTAPCIPTGVAIAEHACDPTPASTASGASAGKSGGCAVGSSRLGTGAAIAILLPFVVVGWRSQLRFAARREHLPRGW